MPDEPEDLDAPGLDVDAEFDRLRAAVADLEARVSAMETQGDATMRRLEASIADLQKG